MLQWTLGYMCLFLILTIFNSRIVDNLVFNSLDFFLFYLTTFLYNFVNIRRNPMLLNEWPSTLNRLKKNARTSTYRWWTHTMSHLPQLWSSQVYENYRKSSFPLQFITTFKIKKRNLSGPETTGISWRWVSKKKPSSLRSKVKLVRKIINITGKWCWS